eukprot:TRINITY_DN29449_c0_g2_i1.p1 TRINITY_DN29449_c0_g2~~TRINITY_DN29449_c0_g2_i1.p1  ORF type:complete len:856 (+),score=240.72 TRINITY_DN29449_c0_g2_i1:96-2570(+)
MGCAASVADERKLRESALAEARELRDRVQELEREKTDLCSRLEDARLQGFAPAPAEDAGAVACAGESAGEAPAAEEAVTAAVVKTGSGGSPPPVPPEIPGPDEAARDEEAAAVVPAADSDGKEVQPPLPGAVPPSDESGKAAATAAGEEAAAGSADANAEAAAADGDAAAVAAAEAAQPLDGAADATLALGPADASATLCSDAATTLAAGESETAKTLLPAPALVRDGGDTGALVSELIAEEEKAAAASAAGALGATASTAAGAGGEDQEEAAVASGAAAANADDASKSAKKQVARGGELHASRDSSEASTCVPPRTAEAEDSALPAAAETMASSDSVSASASASAPSESGCLEPQPTCHQCAAKGTMLYVDPTDMNRYCESCWSEYYGETPAGTENQRLVHVVVSETWAEDRLAGAWLGHTLPGWPPPVSQSPPPPRDPQETWSTVQVRLRRHAVGHNSRQQYMEELPRSGCILAERYRLANMLGEGHFTKAFLAEDLSKGGFVCVKRHRCLSMDQLSDIMVLGKRLDEVDPSGATFPQLFDAFYDAVGFTVESLVGGQNCLAVAHADPTKFRDLDCLRHVARGCFVALELLDRAGVVHNDVKPDNIMWDDSGPGDPRVTVVDFGCARLDQRLLPGRNWALAEGGAGHLGKWSPEMILRLPITHVGDVWGVGISLCELHCGRFVWRNEADTAEVVLAQALGLTGMREGVPSTLLRRSPLDIRQLYTPAPRHYPVRRTVGNRVETLKPTKWGFEQVLGADWREQKADLGQLLTKALAFDPLDRPSASELLASCHFLAPPASAAPAEEAPASAPAPAEDAVPASS